MGLRLFSSSSYSGDTVVNNNPLPNPNPKNHSILAWEKIGKCLILTIKYPDCTNYEGVKILVYLNTTLEQLREQKEIDPHFCENPKYISPIARFAPTLLGMSLAREFAEFIKEERNYIK